MAQEPCGSKEGQETIETGTDNRSAIQEKIYSNRQGGSNTVLERECKAHKHRKLSMNVARTHHRKMVCSMEQLCFKSKLRRDWK